jgi:hypothetical protein
MLGTQHGVQENPFFNHFREIPVMRLKQLAERRVSADTSGGSLRPLSQKEVQQVAGGLYFGDMPFPMPGMPGMPGFPGHGPYPGPGSQLL